MLIIDEKDSPVYVFVEKLYQVSKYHLFYSHPKPTEDETLEATRHTVGERQTALDARRIIPASSAAPTGR